jgi:ATP-dependent Lon protease
MTLSDKIEIPLFPLSMLLMPGERSQLHIFESRYRQLFAELIDTEGHFGVLYSSDSGHRGLGSRCRLVKVLKSFNGGEMDVLIECDAVFRMEDFQSMKEGKLYPYGTCSLLRELAQEQISSEVSQEYQKLGEQLDDADLHFHQVQSKHTLTILASLNISSEDKHAFLNLPSAQARDADLFSKIQMLTSLVIQEKAIESGLYLS